MAETASAPAPGQSPEPNDPVLRPLLDRIVGESLDRDYDVVAKRRSGRAPAPPSRRPVRVATVVMAVFGVLVAIAAVQTSRNASERSAGRAVLISQINERRETVNRLQARLDRLQASTTELRQVVADTVEQEQVLAARIDRLEARAGVREETGPGLRITVDDAPGGDVTQVVRDSDLALLVDGLWNAGAEGIAVNGKRLTALTAFRNVGPAVHIGGTPLVPPYSIVVLGDPDTLPAGLLESTHGQEWYSLAESLGFEFAIKAADEVTLPAARPRRLRVVQPLTATTDPGRPGVEDDEVTTP